MIVVDEVGAEVEWVFFADTGNTHDAQMGFRMEKQLKPLVVAVVVEVVVEEGLVVFFPGSGNSHDAQKGSQTSEDYAEIDQTQKVKTILLLYKKRKTVRNTITT